MWKVQAENFPFPKASLLKCINVVAMCMPPRKPLEAFSDVPALFSLGVT